MPYIDGKEVTEEELDKQLSLPITVPDSSIRINFKWISVKDELPGKYRKVLISNGKDICIGIQQSRYDSLIYCSRYCENCPAGGHEDYAVTHWMELPKPPESQ